MRMNKYEYVFFKRRGSQWGLLLFCYWCWLENKCNGARTWWGCGFVDTVWIVQVTEMAIQSWLSVSSGQGSVSFPLSPQCLMAIRSPFFSMSLSQLHHTLPRPYPPLLGHLDFLIVLEGHIISTLASRCSFLAIPTAFKIHNQASVNSFLLWTPAFVTVSYLSFHSI